LANLSLGMANALQRRMTTATATYEIDSKWKIVRASEAFCRAFRCTEVALLGRDVRDLLRDDWRLDFRTYVARALVGVGDTEATVPMVAPCGVQGWFKHALEPLIEDGVLLGYRAAIRPHAVHAAAPAKRWWESRSETPQQVWNFEGGQLASAS
jgi:PAS domain-containing protein